MRQHAPREYDQAPAGTKSGRCFLSVRRCTIVGLQLRKRGKEVRVLSRVGNIGLLCSNLSEMN